VSDPTPPAGWYPQDGQERWWNGGSWSDSYRPLSAPAPYAAAPGPYAGAPVPPYAAGPYQPYTPPQPSHTARNLLIVFGVLFLLLVGGCTTLVVVAGNRINDVVNDDTPGGPANPLTIEPGKAFEVAGFEYADGWAVTTDSVGDATVTGLTVTNDRGKNDWAFVNIKLLDDNLVTATISCTSPGSRIEQGTTVTLDCTSSDALGSFGRVTIQDAF
jgi:hypothetical protein